jgi:hypothetical protein
MAKSITPLADDLQKRYEAIEKDAYAHLYMYYKALSLGNNRLELGTYSVDYSDGADYTITALDWNYVNNHDEWTFYQDEDGGPESEVNGVPVDTLIDVVRAVEYLLHENAQFNAKRLAKKLKDSEGNVFRIVSRDRQSFTVRGEGGEKDIPFHELAHYEVVE